MTDDDLKIADDRPIAKQQDDLLDRAGFARRLASAISSWNNRESLVIGLTGTWGSGKSSIKNMTLEHLIENDPCQVIEFNPWQWADQDKLSIAFFEEISRIVQRKDATEDNKKLAKLLRKYSQYLHASAGMLSATAKWGPIFLGSALVTTALGSLATGTAAQITIWTISAFAWIGSFTPWIKQGAEWLTNHSKTLDEKAKDNELSLSEIRAELQTLLSARDKPLLIVLDDLDRLSPEQMKAIFQLVKAHMDFANVVFLLIFQRETVEKGLRKAGFNGADYLEKIIQASFNVPAISTARLESVLFERLDAILSEEPQLQARFEQDYWEQMFSSGMRPFFKNLRHVYRYASTLAFHCRLLRGAEVAEVSAVDLFALECLRVFAPDTYEDLPRHKALLTSTQPYGRKDQAQCAHVNQIIEQLVNLAPADHQPATRQLLREILPNLSWVFSDTYHDSQTQLRWLINSRMCRKEMFDRYFELSVPEVDIPNSLLDELSRRITDPEKFTPLLTAFDEDRQGEILQRMLGLVEEFPMDRALAVVQTLMHAGEEVGSRISFTNWSPRVQVSKLLRLFLVRQDDEAARSQLVIEAFAAGPGLVIVEKLLGGDYALRRKGDVGYFDENGLEQLKIAYLQRLRQEAERDPDAFLANQNLSAYLQDLNSYSDGKEEGRLWVERHVTSPARFIKFAQGQVSTRAEHGGRGTIRTDYIAQSTLEQMVGLARCAEWVDQLESANLSDEDLLTLQLVKEALSQKAQGKSAQEGD